MNLHYLKYAVEVDKTGSISKAAENLFMNQPNLSRAIKDLETTLGVPIFERTTKGISATTEDGRVFIEYAKNILAQFEDMRQHFQWAMPQKDILRVSIPRASYISQAFAEFIHELQELEDFYISFQETNSMQTIKNVTQDGYSLGIIRYRALYEKYFLAFIKEKELDYREISCFDSVIVMSDKNPLARRKVLEPSDLNNLIEISNDDFTLPRQLSADKSVTEFLSPSRKQIFVFERGSQFDLLSQVTTTFMWVSPIPQNILTRNGLVQKKCNARDIAFKDILVFRKGHHFSKTELLFLEKLELAKDL